MPKKQDLKLKSLWGLVEEKVQNSKLIPWCWLSRINTMTDFGYFWKKTLMSDVDGLTIIRLIVNISRKCLANSNISKQLLVFKLLRNSIVKSSDLKDVISLHIPLSTLVTMEVLLSRTILSLVGGVLPMENFSKAMFRYAIWQLIRSMKKSLRLPTSWLNDYRYII